VEFLVISLFHQTKIPTIDMKVQEYSNFNKNKIWKKIKSPSSMRIGRFNTSKYRSFKRRRNSQRAFVKIPYSYCPPFWADACPAHTSPKNFKHP
jgi:hypothetical protein